ncbi:hypothetical protein [Siphonobacter sp. SORGH_AS_0500]|uniref:hypothetical protein n=1 Tax=Siphonobacter sp. SORGH_AS_0500 TaxID=1864824 RepID=UPI0028544979|nr:hypothetical protein [Siphonobacter sp. SORGH_AS_0500]MDR6196276.1 hypothetical protein [Siphonobacter sp. SORGH_AS_0500]
MNTPASRFPLIAKVIFGVLFFCLLVVISLWVVGVYFLKPMVGDKLSKSVYENSDQLYQLTFEDITYNPFSGRGSIRGLSIQADSARRRQLISSKDITDLTLDATIPEISLQGAELFTYLLHKKLFIDEIAINQPRLTIRQYPSSGPKKSEEKKTLHELLQKQFKEVEIGKIRLIEAKITHDNQTSEKPITNSIQQLSIEVQQMLVNPESYRDSSRVFYAKNIEVQLDSLTMPSKDQLSNLQVGKLNVSTQTRTLTIENLGTIPAYPRQEYVKRSGGGSYTKAVLSHLHVTGMDLSQLEQKQKVRINKVELEGGRVDAFEVRNRSSKMSGPRKPFPHEQFQKIPFELTIDSVITRKIDLYYDELNPKTEQIGGINFRNIQGVITNLTNDSLTLLKSPTAKAHFQTMFMGANALNTHFTFNMAANNGEYTCQAELGPTNLVTLNATFKPLALMEIESGRVNNLKFKFSGNNVQSWGSGVILYQDLKINILKKDEEKKRFRIRDLFTFAANKILTYDSNPMPKKEVRTGKIEYKRVPGESFFGILWRSIRSCLSDSVLKT